MSLPDLDLRLYRVLREHGHDATLELPIRRFSRLGEHAGVWLALGAAGAALDTPRRAQWLRGTRSVLVAYGLNTVMKTVVRRRRPQLEQLPALISTADLAELPVRPRVVVVRRRARLFGAAAGRAALRRGDRDGAVAGLPRRALPVGHRRRAPCSARSSAARATGRLAMKVGIVGMPNAGKSSLFNALTQAGVDAANYPFTTIEPNIAVVAVQDERLDRLAELLRASNVVPDTIDFHDIAGLVAGAHSGEGLGNRFLANIRETDAIIHVVRAHNDDSIIHPEGRVDPLADIETIETELIFADLEQAERRHDRVVRTARGGDRTAIAEEAWLRELIDALHAGRPARTVAPPADAPHALRDLGPLTAKPVLFVANVDEGDDTVPPAIAEHAAAQGAVAVAVSSRIEAELAELEDEDAAAMRADLGIAESSLQRVVGGAFALLELIVFFTVGEDKPAQSWHLQAAA